MKKDSDIILSENNICSKVDTLPLNYYLSKP